MAASPTLQDSYSPFTVGPTILNVLEEISCFLQPCLRIPGDNHTLGLGCESTQGKKLAFPRCPGIRFGLAWARARQKVAQFPHHRELTQPRGRTDPLPPPGQPPLFTVGMAVVRSRGSPRVAHGGGQGGQPREVDLPADALWAVECRHIGEWGSSSP